MERKKLNCITTPIILLRFLINYYTHGSIVKYRRISQVLYHRITWTYCSPRHDLQKLKGFFHFYKFGNCNITLHHTSLSPNFSLKLHSIFELTYMHSFTYCQLSHVTQFKASLVQFTASQQISNPSSHY